MTSDSRKGREIDIQARAMIARVYHFLREEYDFMRQNNLDNCDLSPLANVRKRTAEATGVSERTVTKVLKEERDSEFAEPTTPKKKRLKKEKKQSGNRKRREINTETSTYGPPAPVQWSYERATVNAQMTDNSSFTKNIVPIQT